MSEFPTTTAKSRISVNRLTPVASRLRTIPTQLARSHSGDSCEDKDNLS